MRSGVAFTLHSSCNVEFKSNVASLFKSNDSRSSDPEVFLAWCRKSISLINGDDCAFIECDPEIFSPLLSRMLRTLPNMPTILEELIPCVVGLLSHISNFYSCEENYLSKVMQDFLSAIAPCIMHNETQPLRTLALGVLSSNSSCPPIDLSSASLEGRIALAVCLTHCISSLLDLGFIYLSATTNFMRYFLFIIEAITLVVTEVETTEYVLIKKHAYVPLLVCLSKLLVKLSDFNSCPPPEFILSDLVRKFAACPTIQNPLTRHVLSHELFLPLIDRNSSHDLPRYLFTNPIVFAHRFASPYLLSVILERSQLSFISIIQQLTQPAGLHLLQNCFKVLTFHSYDPDVNLNPVPYYRSYSSLHQKPIIVKIEAGSSLPNTPDLTPTTTKNPQFQSIMASPIAIIESTQMAKLLANRFLYELSLFSSPDSASAFKDVLTLIASKIQSLLVSNLPLTSQAFAVSLMRLFLYLLQLAPPTSESYKTTLYSYFNNLDVPADLPVALQASFHLDHMSSRQILNPMELVSRASAAPSPAMVNLTVLLSDVLKTPQASLTISLALDRMFESQLPPVISRLLAETPLDVMNALHPIPYLLKFRLVKNLNNALNEPCCLSHLKSLESACSSVKNLFMLAAFPPDSNPIMQQVHLLSNLCRSAFNFIKDHGVSIPLPTFSVLSIMQDDDLLARWVVSVAAHVSENYAPALPAAHRDVSTPSDLIPNSPSVGYRPQLTRRVSSSSAPRPFAAASTAALQSSNLRTAADHAAREKLSTLTVMVSMVCAGGSREFAVDLNEDEDEAGEEMNTARNFPPLKRKRSLPSPPRSSLSPSSSNSIVTSDKVSTVTVLGAASCILHIANLLDACSHCSVDVKKLIFEKVAAAVRSLSRPTDSSISEHRSPLRTLLFGAFARSLTPRRLANLTGTDWLSPASLAVGGDLPICILIRSRDALLGLCEPPLVRGQIALGCSEGFYCMPCPTSSTMHEYLVLAADLLSLHPRATTCDPHTAAFNAMMLTSAVSVAVEALARLLLPPHPSSHPSNKSTCCPSRLVDRMLLDPPRNLPCLHLLAAIGRPLLAAALQATPCSAVVHLSAALLIPSYPLSAPTSPVSAIDFAFRQPLINHGGYTHGIQQPPLLRNAAIIATSPSFILAPYISSQSLLDSQRLKALTFASLLYLNAPVTTIGALLPDASTPVNTISLLSSAKHVLLSSFADARFARPSPLTLLLRLVSFFKNVSVASFNTTTTTTSNTDHLHNMNSLFDAKLSDYRVFRIISEVSDILCDALPEVMVSVAINLARSPHGPHQLVVNQPNAAGVLAFTDPLLVALAHPDETGVLRCVAANFSHLNSTSRVPLPAKIHPHFSTAANGNMDNIGWIANERYMSEWASNAWSDATSRLQQLLSAIVALKKTTYERIQPPPITPLPPFKVDDIQQYIPSILHLLRRSLPSLCSLPFCFSAAEVKVLDLQTVAANFTPAYLSVPYHAVDLDLSKVGPRSRPLPRRVFFTLLALLAKHSNPSESLFELLVAATVHSGWSPHALLPILAIAHDINPSSASAVPGQAVNHTSGNADSTGAANSSPQSTSGNHQKIILNAHLAVTLDLTVGLHDLAVRRLVSLPSSRLKQFFHILSASNIEHSTISSITSQSSSAAAALNSSQQSQTVFTMSSRSSDASITPHGISQLIWVVYLSRVIVNQIVTKLYVKVKPQVQSASRSIHTTNSAAELGIGSSWVAQIVLLLPHKHETPLDIPAIKTIQTKVDQIPHISDVLSFLPSNLKSFIETLPLTEITALRRLAWTINNYSELLERSRYPTVRRVLFTHIIQTCRLHHHRLILLRVLVGDSFKDDDGPFLDSKLKNSVYSALRNLRAFVGRIMEVSHSSDPAVSDDRRLAMEVAVSLGVPSRQDWRLQSSSSSSKAFETPFGVTIAVDGCTEWLQFPIRPLWSGRRDTEGVLSNTELLMSHFIVPHMDNHLCGFASQEIYKVLFDGNIIFGVNSISSPSADNNNIINNNQPNQNTNKVLQRSNSMSKLIPQTGNAFPNRLFKPEINRVLLAHSSSHWRIKDSYFPPHSLIHTLRECLLYTPSSAKQPIPPFLAVESQILLACLPAATLISSLLSQLTLIILFRSIFDESYIPTTTNEQLNRCKFICVSLSAILMKYLWHSSSTKVPPVADADARAITTSYFALMALQPYPQPLLASESANGYLPSYDRFRQKLFKGQVAALWIDPHVISIACIRLGMAARSLLLTHEVADYLYIDKWMDFATAGVVTIASGARALQCEPNLLLFADLLAEAYRQLGEDLTAKQFEAIATDGAPEASLEFALANSLTAKGSREGFSDYGFVDSATDGSEDVAWILAGGLSNFADEGDAHLLEGLTHAKKTIPSLKRWGSGSKSKRAFQNLNLDFGDKEESKIDFNFWSHIQQVFSTVNSAGVGAVNSVLMSPIPSLSPFSASPSAHTTCSTVKLSISESAAIEAHLNEAVSASLVGVNMHDTNVSLRVSSQLKTVSLMRTILFNSIQNAEDFLVPPPSNSRSSSDYSPLEFPPAKVFDLKQLNLSSHSSSIIRSALYEAFALPSQANPALVLLPIANLLCELKRPQESQILRLALVRLERCATFLRSPSNLHQDSSSDSHLMTMPLLLDDPSHSSPAGRARLLSRLLYLGGENSIVPLTSSELAEYGCLSSNLETTTVRLRLMSLLEQAIVLAQAGLKQDAYRLIQPFASVSKEGNGNIHHSVRDLVYEARNMMIEISANAASSREEFHSTVNLIKGKLTPTQASSWGVYAWHLQEAIEGKCSLPSDDLQEIFHQCLVALKEAILMSPLIGDGPIVFLQRILHLLRMLANFAAVSSRKTANISPSIDVEMDTTSTITGSDRLSSAGSISQLQKSNRMMEIDVLLGVSSVHRNELTPMQAKAILNSTAAEVIRRIDPRRLYLVRNIILSRLFTSPLLKPILEEAIVRTLIEYPAFMVWCVYPSTCSEIGSRKTAARNIMSLSLAALHAENSNLKDDSSSAFPNKLNNTRNVNYTNNNNSMSYNINHEKPEEPRTNLNLNSAVFNLPKLSEIDIPPAINTLINANTTSSALSTRKVKFNMKCPVETTGCFIDTVKSLYDKREEENRKFAHAVQLKSKVMKKVMSPFIELKNDKLHFETYFVPPTSSLLANPTLINPPFIIRVEGSKEFFSKQRPIKMDFLDNTGKEHSFLLKSEPKGDIRKDAKTANDIPQTINNLLAGEARGPLNGLWIEPYYVTPVGEHVGIFEWIQNSMPLKEAITSTYELGISDSKRKFREYQEKCANIYKISNHRFLVEESKPHFARDLHRYFLECLPSCPPVLQLYFRLQFGRHDASRWLEAIHKFTKSMAVWSILCFLLGIGDRHGDNMMLKTNKGSIVHIDFDQIFSKGVNLPVSELVPCRLTHQITYNLGPLGVYGRFFDVCVATMALFRGRGYHALKSFLVSIVDDPLFDFQISKFIPSHFKVGLQGVHSSEASRAAAVAPPIYIVSMVERRLNGMCDFHPQRFPHAQIGAAVDVDANSVNKIRIPMTFSAARAAADADENSLSIDELRSSLASVQAKNSSLKSGNYTQYDQNIEYAEGLDLNKTMLNTHGKKERLKMRSPDLSDVFPTRVYVEKLPLLDFDIKQIRFPLIDDGRRLSVEDQISQMVASATCEWNQSWMYSGWAPLQ